MRWVRNLGKIVGFDEQGRPARMLGVAIDVTPQREQEVMLQRLALYDALTGLPYRVLLARKLQKCMAQARDTGKQLGVAYLDLDGFKPVNDRLGHGRETACSWWWPGASRARCARWTRWRAWAVTNS